MKKAAEEDQMQGLSGREEKIFVSVRLRPLNEKEIARNDVSDWECIDDTTITYKSHLSVSERSMYPSSYTFDRVFGPECGTRQVYEQGAKEVALSVVSGVNASVFAYGQTSSGKTYTMTGITDCTVADIYDYIDKHKEREFTLKFSAMEIYNESVRDLLSTDSSPLRLLDDLEKGTLVEKLTEETLQDLDHFKDLLSVCEVQRQIGDTAVNEVSSRSHQILRLTIESAVRNYQASDKSSTLTATVNFVDLAGSERASQSLSAGTRLKEGFHINRSLLTLGTVIRKLSKGKTGHIPFRDSKLTRILQLSLGGNARTAIICTMSPAKIHVEQSRNTLLFGSCAKEVTTNAHVNVVTSDKALVRHLQRELARREYELRSPGRAFVEPDTAALLREKDLQIEKLEKEVFELTQQLALSRSQFEEFQRMVGEENRPEKDISSTESVVGEHQYPKLRVRNSWDSENVTPESPLSVQPSSLSPRSTEPSYDESVFQLSDFRMNSWARSPPQHLLFGTPEEFTGVQLRIRATETKEHSDAHEETADQPCISEEQFLDVCEQPDRNSEDSYMIVRCVEMEESGMSSSICSEPNTVECTAKQYEDASALPVPEPESESLRLPTETEDEEEKLKEISGTSLQPEDEREPVKMPPQSVSPSLVVCFPQQLNGNMSNLRKNPARPGFIIPSPEKPFLWRSKSCRASWMSSSPFSWIDKDEKSESTPPSWYEKEFIRTTDSSRTTPSLHYNSGDERLLLNDLKSVSTTWLGKYSSGRPVITHMMLGASQDCINNGMASPSETQACPSESSMCELQNCTTRTPDKEEKTVDMGNPVLAAQKDKRVIHRLMEDRENKLVTSKSYRDPALDTIQVYLATPLNWEMEFKRLQREIIELWHICSVSLGHRSHFFLLYRGERKDCLYMEIELRRLKHRRTLSTTSSVKALKREREKLSKLMEKKMSREERENLFLRWGIGLNTKHRRLQLAHRLWSETKDMNHVGESASVVGKLLGVVESQELPSISKDTPPDNKSSRWKRSVRSFSLSIL